MGRNCLIRPCWNIINEKVPATVADVIDILLENRNLQRQSIAGDLKDLAEYLSIRGMREGAALLARHLANGSKIVIVADYDCDGITSASQLALFLEEIGYADFDVIIPLREEGYGIPERAIRENADARLFVAVDCGTLDVKQVELARSIGADCLVIDHHEVPDGKTAPVSVLINPKHPDCCSTFKEFCAAGLTLLFLAALRHELKSKNFSRVPAIGGKYLALAATGTVADLVPLVAGNRILAGRGLHNLNANTCPPLSRLADDAGLSGKTLTAGHISFYLGPRINAAGRISDGRIAYDLLTGNRPDELARLSGELNSLNAKRQAEEEKILQDIHTELDGRPPRTRTLVLGDPAWPPGVIGIAASRVQQELHYGPVVIFSIDRERHIARGSARSVPGYDIHHALARCSDLLVKWGGHKAAAGLTISVERIADFRDRFEEIAQESPPGIFTPQGKVDMELPLSLAGPALVEALRELEPHGMGNPAPVFGLRNARFAIKRSFGKEGKHLRLEFERGLEGVYWNGADRLAAFHTNGSEGCLDMVFQMGWDKFYDRPSIDIKDLGTFFQARPIGSHAS